MPLPFLAFVRTLLLVLAAGSPWVAVALASGAEPTPATTTRPAARPALAAAVTSCTTGLLAADRTAVFTGSIPMISGAATMAMRFELYERTGATGTFRRLPVANFGTWQRSDPRVAGFVYDKRVQMLLAPAAYRVTIHFRWFDAGGKVVRRASRTSAACEQPDLRPELRVTRLIIGAARPDGTVLYAVTIRNDGPSAIRVPFQVGLDVGRAVQPPQELPVLDGTASATLTFVGPSCSPGSRVVATVDPRRAVDEADEDDNSARRTCPG